MSVIESPELAQARSEIESLNKDLQRFKTPPSQPAFIFKYGVPVLSIGVAFVIILFLRTYIGQGSTPMGVLFLCAIISSAWFGGFRPGLLAVGLSLLAFTYLYASPSNFLFLDAKEIPRLILFTICDLIVLWMTASQRKASQSLRHARDILEETVDELQRSNRSLRQENSERQRAEALLHAKEQEFRAIVENAPDQIVRYDRDFRRVYLNPAVAKAYGLPRESLIGKPIGSAVHETALTINPHQVDHAREQISSVFNTGNSSEFELIWPLVNGERNLNVRLFPELDVSGRVMNVLGIAQDITERKEAEEALRQSEDRLRLVIDTIPIMAWSVQSDGAVDFLNQGWLDYSGITFEQLTEDPSGLIHPEDRTVAVEKWLACMTAGEFYEAEMRLRRADGEYRRFLVRTAPLRDTQGTITKWYGVSTDIEDLKRAEERIKATTEQLRALSARHHLAKEEEDIRIAREIHDEMGSVLTSLRWELEQFDNGILGAEASTQRQLVNARISEMIKLTDIAISTTKRIAADLRPSLLDDLGLVDALEWQAEQFQERSSVECHFDCTGSHYEFDPEQSTAIFRIVQEALTNVRRHAKATVVNVVMRAADGGFVLTISDNGQGISESEKSGAHSLGLLGMRERAHLIGAELGIIGVEGKGTTVTLKLPATGLA